MSADFEFLMDLYRENLDLFEAHAPRVLKAGTLTSDESARIAKMLPSVLPEPKSNGEANQFLSHTILELMKRTYPGRSVEILLPRLSDDTGIRSDRLKACLDGSNRSSEDMDALLTTALAMLKHSRPQSRISPTPPTE